MENNLDWIESVKIAGEGYLVNGSMSVPKADGNRHYEEIKVWLETNTPEPEFTEAEIAAQELQVAISEAKTLLADTDFYVIRQMEEGIEIPADVQTARSEAKTLLRDNDITYTLGA
jgi:hypothetical protein